MAALQAIHQVILLDHHQVHLTILVEMDLVGVAVTAHHQVQHHHIHQAHHSVIPFQIA